MDFTISEDRSQERRRKFFKWRDIEREIQCMWKMKKTEVNAVIIGATGAISNSSRKSLNYVPGRNVNKELKKTAKPGNTHVLRKVLL